MNIKKEIFLKVFCFNYKINKLPFYVKYTATINSSTTIKDILEELNNSLIVKIAYDNSSIVLINEKYYASLTENIYDIVIQYGQDITIDSADNRYSKHDLLLNEDQYNSKSDLISIKNNSTEVKQILKRSYYSCTVTKLFSDFISPVYIIKAYIKLFIDKCDDSDKVKILNRLADPVDGIFNTTEANLFTYNSYLRLDYITLVAKLKSILIEDSYVSSVDESMVELYKNYRKDILEYGIINLDKLYKNSNKMMSSIVLKSGKFEQRSNIDQNRLKKLLEK